MGKSIVDYIYSENSLEKILESSISYLKKKNDINSIQHAASLNEYRNIRFNSALLEEIDLLTLDIHNFLNTSKPTSKHMIQSRVKSLLDLEQKILRNIFLNLSVDIKDILGIRIILFDQNTHEGIINTYESIFDIIEYIMSKGYILCFAEKPINTENFDKSKFSNIVIPTKEDLSSLSRYSTYQYGFKDYIFTPKEDTAYQSLHTIFKSQKGDLFEIQFRNFYMHKCSFNHGIYKRTKYKYIELDVDPQKIHTPNFFVTEKGEILDYDGIIQPVNKSSMNNL
jgi:hypothetical protein